MIRTGDCLRRPTISTKTLALRALCFIVFFGTGETAHTAITDSVRFFVLDGFLGQAAPPDSNVIIVEPAESAARVLAAYYAITDSAADDFSTLPDPLRIPNPFDLAAGRSMELFERTAARLRQCGIAFVVSYPADFAEAEQIATQRIARGHPVLAVHPHPILLFGYDYREPDPFWYVWRFSPSGESEIITRSEWRAQWWLWEADPTSVILIEIAGPDTTESPRPTPKKVLDKILTTAKTDTSTGVTSYIRPILRLIDSLSRAPAPPQIVHIPENLQDPLGLHRAEIQRKRFREYLASLAPRARAVAVQESMRLAMYSAAKAASEYAAARGALYTPNGGAAPADSATVVDIIARRWVEHRLEAADHLTEALRWEKQMLSAIKEITAKKKPFRR